MSGDEAELNNLDELMESAPRNYDGEDDDNFDEGAAADQAINSSCSYEDIDTEVIREMDLSRATKHPA